MKVSRRGLIKSGISLTAIAAIPGVIVGAQEVVVPDEVLGEMLVLMMSGGSFEMERNWDKETNKEHYEQDFRYMKAIKEWTLKEEQYVEEYQPAVWSINSPDWRAKDKDLTTPQGRAWKKLRKERPQREDYIKVERRYFTLVPGGNSAERLSLRENGRIIKDYGCSWAKLQKLKK